MNKIFFAIVCGLLLLNAPVEVFAEDNSLLCTDVGELMYGDQQKCKKGDIIIVNAMMAAVLCDMSLPIVSGDNNVVCHYLGKKREVRESKK
jgi:hypothetical protein